MYQTYNCEYYICMHAHSFRSFFKYSTKQKGNPNTAFIVIFEHFLSYHVCRSHYSVLSLNLKPTDFSDLTCDDFIANNLPIEK